MHYYSVPQPEVAALPGLRHECFITMNCSGEHCELPVSRRFRCRSLEHWHVVVGVNISREPATLCLLHACIEMSISVSLSLARASQARWSSVDM